MRLAAGSHKSATVAFAGGGRSSPPPLCAPDLPWCGMHPPLTPGNHPLCLHVIADLKKCHEQHPWGKLLGACNTQKWALDACFRAEVSACVRCAGRGRGVARPVRCSH